MFTFVEIAQYHEPKNAKEFYHYYLFMPKKKENNSSYLTLVTFEAHSILKCI